MNDIKFTKQQIIAQAVFTAEDKNIINKCRGSHNRLGFAYQMAFLRLTGYFPTQKPIEIIEDLLQYVSAEVDVSFKNIENYAKRQATVSEHQEQLRDYLNLRKYGNAEEQLLKKFLINESFRLEETSSLFALSQEFLKENKVIIPSQAKLKRLIGEQRKKARNKIFNKIANVLSQDQIKELDGLLETGNKKISKLQLLKEVPNTPSPIAITTLISKLENIAKTEAFTVDISWLNNNFKKTLSRRIKNSSVHAIKRIEEKCRYSALICFLQQTYVDTVDFIIEIHDKLITRIWTHANNQLDEEIAKQKKSLKAIMQMFRTIGKTVLNQELSDRDVRNHIFSYIPKDILAQRVQESEDWISGKNSDPFVFVKKKFSYLRKFTPKMLNLISYNAEEKESESLVEALKIVQETNNSKKKLLPKNIPTDFVPKKYKRFLKENGQIDRQAYECLLYSNLKNEIKNGNIWVKNSKKYKRIQDYFMPETDWNRLRSGFFERAGLPINHKDVKEYIAKRYNTALNNFEIDLKNNTYISFENEGWSFKSDPAETLDKYSERKLKELEKWLDSRLPKIKLPDLLIEVDNIVNFTRHFIPDSRKRFRRKKDISKVISAIMAYGCNIGPYTMAQIIPDVTYEEIKNIADWYMNENVLRKAIGEIVDAITSLETNKIWGEGKASSSDGQRFIYPRNVLQSTWSQRVNDFAMEFYSFVADNYAPFYSLPIECTDRDAAYTLDGLLYNESELLEIEEHYTDTHGYTEINFTAFNMNNIRFCPRIKGLKDQRIYKIDNNRDYGVLNNLLNKKDRTINLDSIVDQWDKMGQFYASLRAGYSTASIAMKRLMSYGPKNNFYKANRELGRFFKTEFIFDFLSNPILRRKIQRGLLKGEQLHSLARNVFYGKLGKNYNRDLEQQSNTASSLILILASIVFWQSKQIQNILKTNSPDKDNIDSSLLLHVSPISWENVILYGEYKINKELIK